MNEKEQGNNSIFNRCKKSVLDYMSLKTPAREQISRIINKIGYDNIFIDNKMEQYRKLGNREWL